MTAEIAILNKSSVALAADSAVTIPTLSEEGAGEKTYNTVNKLFTLSKYHPIGVMIYGGADITGVPWETVIKMYRAKLRNRSFQSVKEYGEDFVKFLDKNTALFPKEQQSELFHYQMHSYFHAIRSDIDDEIESAFKNNKRVTRSFVARTAKRVIEEHYKSCEKAKRLKGIPVSHHRKIVTLYKKGIRDFRLHVFEKVPLSQIEIRRLTQIAGNLFCRYIFPTSSSGVVITGFGAKETFPALYAFRTIGVVGNRLSYRETHSAKIGDDSRAQVIPFAQTAMTDTFMCGIHPEYYEITVNFLTKILGESYPEEIIKALPQANNKKNNDLRKKLRAAGKTIVQKFIKDAGQYERENHTDKIMSAISVLPKEELAAMAESLIYLTALRQRISLEAETVGGPIDVAVVSKGDGFVWIKRKQYFKPDLNPHFIRNYFHG